MVWSCGDMLRWWWSSCCCRCCCATSSDQIKVVVVQALRVRVARLADLRAEEVLADRLFAAIEDEVRVGRVMRQHPLLEALVVELQLLAVAGRDRRDLRAPRVARLGRAEHRRDHLLEGARRVSDGAARVRRRGDDGRLPHKLDEFGQVAQRVEVKGRLPRGALADGEDLATHGDPAGVRVGEAREQALRLIDTRALRVEERVVPRGVAGVDVVAHRGGRRELDVEDDVGLVGPHLVAARDKEVVARRAVRAVARAHPLGHVDDAEELVRELDLVPANLAERGAVARRRPLREDVFSDRRLDRTQLGGRILDELALARRTDLGEGA
mmetsp:Transcript_40189/g.99985  ORF Transcript_40189/g.99985 Transcript_40189/m.99985 type:complete len:326 (+) Transcript_40189:382-1359(+)